MTQKWLQRGFIYPSFALIANLCEEVASYYTQKLHSPHWQTITIIACILIGFGLLAYLLDAIVQKTLRQAHRSSRKQAGLLGEVVIIAAVAASLYWAYYQLMTQGVTGIIPPALR